MTLRLLSLVRLSSLVIWLPLEKILQLLIVQQFKRNLNCREGLDLRNSFLPPSLGNQPLLGMFATFALKSLGNTLLFL